MPCTLVTGPVRSGKSRFAESLARASGGAVTYVATARVDPADAEWAARLAHHAASRPPAWRVVETARPGAPPLADLARTARAGETLLVESLGTWLADRMSRGLESGDEAAALDGGALEAELTIVVDALATTRAHAIVVGEEAGWGLVPPYPAGRVFRDVLGRAQQRLAARASAAYLVVAGFALDLRALGTRVDPA
ncbi:MAG: bifunctional adenosylcobinamide kinase/adenosylcobinamide-phosphate guanylyltransferase [Vulcanimicrobiaceae bacterium]